MKKIVLALFVMFAFIIVACTGMKQSLKGKEFIYQKTAPSSEITLGFDTQGNRVYGSSGVNRYFGNYTQKGNQLQFGPLASTMMAGPQELMEQEQGFLKEMADVVSFELKDKELILKTKTNKELFFKQK